MQQTVHAAEVFEIFLRCRKICTDTRKIEKGALFFALRGEHFNANLLAQEALEKGCSYAVVDDETLPENPRFLRVDHVLDCLQQVASLYRQQFKIPFIGITGTNGKTTTKELIYQVLSQKYVCHCTQGNFNNHIGVPLTILSIPENCEIAIIEMGANHPGEIADLCRISMPTLGVITNIGQAHLEGFGHFENIVETKTALYRSVVQNQGKLFVNGDDSLLMDCSREMRRICYGHSPSCYVCGEVADSSTPYLSFNLKNAETASSTLISTHLIGEYNLDNLLVAACIGRFLGVSDAQIKRGIEAYIPSNLRSQLQKTENNTLILDTYNANPTSMLTSLKSFDKTFSKNKAYILGDMRELGAQSEAEHLKILQYLDKEGAERVFLVGENFGKMLPAIKNRSWLGMKTVEDLKTHLQSNPIKDCTVFLKGSHSVGLEKILENL